MNLLAIETMNTTMVDGEACELLQAQAHIWNHTFNFINSMSLKCAVELGIPDIIHNHDQKPITLSELIDTLKIDPSKAPFVYRLMRILTHSGFFVNTKIAIRNEEEEEEEAFFLTPPSKLLLKDDPLSLRPFLLAELDPILTTPWHSLSDWFLNNDLCPSVTTYGRKFWDMAGQEPRLNQFFNEGMTSDSRLASYLIIRNHKQAFEGLNSLVDVGGGTGTMAKAISGAFPQLKCTVLDLPHVVQGLEGTKNLAYVGGDMFAYIPPTDAVLLKWILHDWSDEESIEILKKCKEAIPNKERGGKVIILDIVLDDWNEYQTTETQLFFDMLMMVVVTGQERSVKDWTELFSKLQVAIDMSEAVVDGKASELLQAHAHIWNHIFNFINSMSLKCSVQLGIPDIIHNHGKPMTLSELIHALKIDPSKALFLYRLMRILIHSGFFVATKIAAGDENNKEAYLLTPASKLLLKDNPSSVSPFLLAMLDPLLTTPWHHLGDWFRGTELNPFVTTHGSKLWEMAGQEPRLNQFFNEGMASDARFVSSLIIENYKQVFEGLNSLVDVGGGTGTMAKAIADAFPQLKCIVLDLPHAIQGVEGSKNLVYVGGDMFESVPSTDAVLLKWILHDWSDEESIKILTKCREAIPSKERGGKVIIVDMVLGDQNEDETTKTQLFFDMLMMVLVSGRERNENDWARLLFKAGFSDYKITPLLGLRSLIEVYY